MIGKRKHTAPGHSRAMLGSHLLRPESYQFGSRVGKLAFHALDALASCEKCHHDFT